MRDAHLEGQSRGTERALGHAPGSEARRGLASATSWSCSCVRCPCLQRLSGSSWRRASRQISKQAWKRTWACSWQPAAAVRQRSDVPLRGLARGLAWRLASGLAAAPARAGPSGWHRSPTPPCRHSWAGPGTSWRRTDGVARRESRPRLRAEGSSPSWFPRCRSARRDVPCLRATPPGPATPRPERCRAPDRAAMECARMGAKTRPAEQPSKDLLGCGLGSLCRRTEADIREVVRMRQLSTRPKVKIYAGLT